MALGAGATTTTANEIAIGTLANNVVIAGTTTTNGLTNTGDIRTTTLNVTGATTLDGATTINNSLTVTSATTTNGITNAGDINTTTLRVNGITTLTGALNANGGITTSSFTSTTIDGTGTSILQNEGGTVAMGVQNGTSVTALIIEQTGPAQLWGDLRVMQGGGENGGNLAVDQNATVGGTLGVTGATTLAGLTAGASTLASAAITNNATVGGTLGVTGATTLAGLTAGASTLASAAITNNATVGGTLGVTGATTLNGATTVNNSLAVNGATTVVGTTNINTTGTAATSIGNSAAAVALTGSTASVTGGSTNLTLNNNGASFSNAGAPAKVTGIANGTGDFDAVNVRQFSNAVASVAAAANIPGVDTNQKASMGLGFGSYMNSQALAFGGSYRFSSNGVLRGSLSTGLSNGGGQSVIGVGAGWSW